MSQTKLELLKELVSEDVERLKDIEITLPRGDKPNPTRMSLRRYLLIEQYIEEAKDARQPDEETWQTIERLHNEFREQAKNTFDKLFQHLQFGVGATLRPMP